MNGSRNLHDGLTRRFADAVTAVCDGNGWVTVQHTDGTRTEAPCPACRQERLIPAVRDFLPPGFAVRSAFLRQCRNGCSGAACRRRIPARPACS